jgi:hypothetical protein
MPDTGGEIKPPSEAAFTAWKRFRKDQKTGDPKRIPGPHLRRLKRWLPDGYSGAAGAHFASGVDNAPVACLTS